MSASRRIVWPPVAASAPLRRGVDACPVIESERSAMLKDLILIEAALASDKTVVSRDDTVRRLFRANLARLRALRPVVWVNPERPDEAAVDWLRSGAKPERRRQLGWVQEAGG